MPPSTWILYLLSLACFYLNGLFQQQSKETLPLNKRIAQSYVLKLQMKDGVGDGGEERLVLFFASLLTRTQRKPLLLTIC